MNSEEKKQSDALSTSKKDQDEQNLEQIQSLIENLPEEKRLQVIETIDLYSSFKGPIPSPEDFHEYNKTLPGAAERIMRMAEEEQNIRKTDITYSFKHKQTRIRIAGFVAFSLIGVAGLATWLGSAIIAIPLGLVGLATIIIRFISEILDRRKNS